jgi:hypothetical protein
MGHVESVFGDPTVKYRNDREDMLTPDGITHSTSLNSGEGESDDDDAVLHPKASGIAIPIFHPIGYRKRIRNLNTKIASLEDKVTQDHEARNERAEKITRRVTILESKRHQTNQHELTEANGAGQSQPDTMQVATAFQGQTTEMLDDSSKLPQYVRENEFQGLFTPSYLPILHSSSRNERRSTPIEDERETTLLLDGECSKTTGKRVLNKVTR